MPPIPPAPSPSCKKMLPLPPPAPPLPHLLPLLLSPAHHYRCHHPPTLLPARSPVLLSPTSKQMSPPSACQLPPSLAYSTTHLPIRPPASLLAHWPSPPPVAGVVGVTRHWRGHGGGGGDGHGRNGGSGAHPWWIRTRKEHTAGSCWASEAGPGRGKARRMG